MKPQTAFKLLTAVVTLWAAREFSSVQETLTARIAHDPSYPQVTELWPAVLIAVAVYCVRTMWSAAVRPLALKMIPRGNFSALARGVKAHRLTVTAFKGIFFALSATLAAVVLYDQPWTPPELGGSGSADQLLYNYPYQRTFQKVKLYYYVCAAYHLTLMMDLLFETPFPDFWEDTLRCAVGVLLITFSYMNNFLRIGSLILFIHDITDALTCWCKVFVGTEYKGLTVSIFLCLLVTWAYLRMWCFASLILYPIFNALRGRMPPNFAISEFHGKSWIIFCLLTLLLLNIYWFSLMLRMLVYFIRFGKTKDMHAKLSEGEEDSLGTSSKSNLVNSSHLVNPSVSPSSSSLDPRHRDQHPQTLTNDTDSLKRRNVHSDPLGATGE